jgi:HEPN domain-containing protein
MAYRAVLWSDEWPDGAKVWTFEEVDHHDLRKRGFVPVAGESERTFTPPPGTKPTESVRFRRWRSEDENRSCWLAETPDAFQPQPASSTSHGGFCSQCRRAMPPLRHSAFEFFERGTVRCRNCQTENDIWQMAVANTTESAGLALDIFNLGAFGISFLIELSPHEVKQIDLLGKGVPHDASILNLVFTTQGEGVHALLVQGNDALRRLNPAYVIVYGMPMGQARPDPVNIAVWAVWVKADDTEDAWRLIADALEAIKQDRRAQALALIHSAVEKVLKSLIREVVTSIQPGDLPDLTASVATAVVLPLLSNLAGGRPLPTEIRQLLLKLRAHRNKVSHGGVANGDISLPEASQLLVAGAFAFEYVRYLRWKFACAGKLPMR